MPKQMDCSETNSRTAARHIIREVYRGKKGAVHPLKACDGFEAVKVQRQELLQLRAKAVDVEERQREQVLKRAKAAQLEMHVSCRSDDANSNFQQLEPNGINAISTHGLR